jgi:nucleoside-diphosphate-sugar epimerase
MVTINQLVSMAMEIAGKPLHVRHVPGPLGVRGRNSDNRMIQDKLGWKPTRPLSEGMRKTYAWIAERVAEQGHELAGVATAMGTIGL